jgi:rhodanese-related sulfurtransferase
MRHIRATELKAWLDDAGREPPLLLDVREPWEFERCHIAGARLLPMSVLAGQYPTLDPARETVVVCHHGVRSYHVARFLEHNGFENLINLTGGIDAWAKEVDPEMPTY